jgi:polyphosphate kinase 2 (PPK2 family)
VSEREVKRRFMQIQEFENLLSDNGTAIVKLFLHISKGEQKERLEARIRNPEKRWKWDSGDIEERKLWSDYMKAFEDVMSATSTDNAPWYVVPANRKWYRNLVIADRVVRTVEDMKLGTPPAATDVDWNRLRIT